MSPLFYRLDYATVMVNIIYSLPASVKHLTAFLTKKHKKKPRKRMSRGFQSHSGSCYLKISIRTCDTMTTAMRATG